MAVTTTFRSFLLVIILSRIHKDLIADWSETIPTSRMFTSFPARDVNINLSPLYIERRTAYFTTLK